MLRKCSACGCERFRLTLVGTCLFLECFGCGAELILSLTVAEEDDLSKFLTTPGEYASRKPLGDLIDA